MKPLVIAHRGASAYAPENTLAAFSLAFELGADGIELDVELTSDGVPMVFHADPAKQTHGIRSLTAMTLAEVKRLDAGVWFNAKCLGERIPTLSEVMSTIGARGLVVIELKWTSVSLRNAILERATAKVLSEAPNGGDWTISSFHPLALRRMRNLAPGVPRALIYQTKIAPAVLNGPWFRFLAAPQALHVDADLVDPRFIAWARRKRYHVVAWHTERPEEMERLCGLDVDGIMTNAPDVLRRVVDKNSST